MMACDTGYAPAMSRRYDDDFNAVFGGPDRGDLGFFCATAAAAGGPICEVGAGTGRVLLPVARVTDQPVVGVEPSPAMRALLERQIDDARGDLGDRARALAGTFDAIPLPDASQALAYSAFRSFQHLLSPAAQLAGLAELRRVIKPGGRLVIDLFDPDYSLLQDTESTLHSVYASGPDREVARFETRRVDRVNQCVKVTFRWIERAPSSGELLGDEQASYTVRYTFPWELVHLVARAGFELEALYGDYDRRPVEAAPCELIVVARRSEP